MTEPMRSGGGFQNRNPFGDGDDDNLNQNENSERSWNLPQVLPEEPDSPPPPPPTSPKSSRPSRSPIKSSTTPTIVKLPKKSPGKTPANDKLDKEGRRQQRRRDDKTNGTNNTSNNKDRNTITGGGGKKKRKKGKRTKNLATINNASDTKPRGSYGQQYNTRANYDVDENDHCDRPAPRIVNYPIPKQNQASKNKLANVFSSLFSTNNHNTDDGEAPSKAKKTTTTEYECEYGFNSEDPSLIRDGTYDSTHNPNTGELNSALGEGTTIPEVLDRTRILHVLHILAVFILEWNSFFWHVISLQIERVLLAVGLVFLAVLLGCFEAVRGEPTLARSHIARHSNIRFGTPVSSGLTANGLAAGAVVYELVLSGRRERIRNFLHKYVGILYSCIGRGIYLCVMGGLSWAHNTLLMEILGVSFGILGVWTITLHCRYPGLVKIYKEQKSMKRNVSVGVDDDSSVGGSIIAWSSVVSTVEGSKAEGKPLLV